MAQLFIANSLNNLLRFWEDCNIYAEFIFRLNLSNQKSNGSIIYPCIGSELTPIGMLGRSIPQYENLRKVLMGHPLTHETNFMPRIPKEKRDFFENTQKVFSELGYMIDVLKTPQYLLKWNETRRVCIVDDSLPVPMIDLRNENHLNKLPYSSFLLRVASPFIFPKNGDNEESTMDTFLIYEESNAIHILSWSHENEEKYLFTDAERQKLLDDTDRLKKNKKMKERYASEKAYGWFMLHFTISKDQSNPILGYFTLNNKEHIFYREVYNQEQNLDYKHIAMIEMINGFCKIMANLPPSPPVKIEGSQTGREIPLPSRQWFELPNQMVDYLETEKFNDTVVIKRAVGREKSPHIRRAHTRRIVGADGKKTEVWIEQVTVRQDKLISSQLQGGAISIKQKT